MAATAAPMPHVPKPLREVFDGVIKTLGEGADRTSKDLAKAKLENAYLRMEVKDAEKEKDSLAERANNYAIAVNQRLEQSVADISGTTIALTTAGMGVGFVSELALPAVMTSYPTVAKALPYVAGVLGLGLSYVLTEPSELERQQGVAPDLASRYNGYGISAGLIAGAGVAQIGQSISDAIVKAIPQGA